MENQIYSWLLKSTDAQTWQQVYKFEKPYTNMLMAESGGSLKAFVAVPGKGLYFASSSLTDWQQLSIGNGIPRVIVQDPINTNVLYSAFSSADGGLYKSLDFGQTWNHLTYDRYLSDVWTIAISPMDSKLLFVGTSGYQMWGAGGLFKSADGGSSWERVDTSISIPYEDSGGSAKRCIKSVLFSNDGSVLFIGLSDDGYDYNNNKGVYYSLDNGTTFVKIVGLPINNINTLTADPFDRSIIWVGTEGGGSYKVQLDNLQKAPSPPSNVRITQ
jgi:hypothetical protein